MAGARRVVQEERLLRGDRLGVADELDRLVRQILREVVALLRGLGLIDRVVVVDQVRIPLVRLRPEEPVPALEAPTGRPVPARRREVHLVVGAQVPLADHVRVPAELTEDLRDRAVLRRDRSAGVRKPDRRLGDARHAVAGVVATGQQTRTGRRAQRRGVPLLVAHTIGGDRIDVRRVDRTAVAAHRREPHVVEHDVHHARSTGRCLRRLERRPVRRRVPDVDVDRALERCAHDVFFHDSSWGTTRGCLSSPSVAHPQPRRAGASPHHPKRMNDRPTPACILPTRCGTLRPTG